MLKEIIFPSQEKDEKIILLLRKHWFIAFRIIFFYSFFLIIPVVAFFILKSFYPETLDGLLSENFYPFLILGVSLYYLIIWQNFLQSWLNYYLDVYIVTNKRIVDVEQAGLFKRIIAEQKLFRVQDVTTEIEGVLPTFLHYGNVNIQTAGTKERFVFEQIPHPYSVSKKIIEMVEISKENQF